VKTNGARYLIRELTGYTGSLFSKQQYSQIQRFAVIKPLLYPFIAAQVAVELIVAEAREELRKALQQVLVDTLSDAREINELKAEIAVLRSEINEIRYDKANGSGKSKAGVS